MWVKMHQNNEISMNYFDIPLVPGPPFPGGLFKPRFIMNFYVVGYGLIGLLTILLQLPICPVPACLSPFSMLQQ